jgi:hypothetical protein
MGTIMDKKYGVAPDKVIHQQLEHLRASSTYGSHDQGDAPGIKYSESMVRAQIETFEKVLVYFRDYVERLSVAAI